MLLSTNKTRDELLAVLKESPAMLEQQTRSLSDAELDFRPEASAWTIRENLAHLVNNEMVVMRTRLERMLKEDQPELPLHDEQAWYAQRNTARDTIDELLGDFAIQRAASLGIFVSMRAEEWKREALHAEFGCFNIAEWLERWAEHDLAHRQQIEKNRAAYKAASHSH